MAVNAQYPGNLGWYLTLQFHDRGRYFVEFGATLRLQLGSTGVEKYFRLQDEPVSDDTNVRSVAENFSQFAKELRTVARKLLKMLGQRNI